MVGLFRLVMRAEMLACVGLHTKRPLFLSDFNICVCVYVFVYSYAALNSTKSRTAIPEMNGGYNGANWRYARFQTHLKTPEAVPPLLGVRLRTRRIRYAVRYAILMRLETQSISQAS